MSQDPPLPARRFEITVEIPGTRSWCERLHADFDAWTLRMMQEGPAEAAPILPSFQILGQESSDRAQVKLNWVDYPGESSWLAVKDLMEEVAGVVFGGLLDSDAPMRITVKPA
jgi:hypothetical protein